MKLTKSRLKQIIKEELSELTAPTVRAKTQVGHKGAAARDRSADAIPKGLNPTQQHNLLNIFNATNKSNEVISLHDATMMVEELALLSDYKIVKPLGAGAFGNAFLLDNDHVLKIFTSGLEGVEDELANYANLQDKQFMGTAEINEPAVYGYGPIKFTNYYFAEIGKVLPLEDWYDISGRNALQKKDLWALVHFKNALSDLIESYSQDTLPSDPEFKQRLLKIFSRYSADFEIAGMTREEIMSYFKAVLNLIREYGLGRSYDVHHQNVGVNIQNPSEFVIFDF